MQSTSRRTFLAIGALASAGALAACTSGSGGSPNAGPKAGSGRRDDPDLPLRGKAVTALDALLAQYAAAQGGDPALIAQARAELAAERTALTTGLPGTPTTAGGSPTAATTAATPAALAAAEKSTAQALLADLPTASGPLARMLAAVSAAGALRAVRLGDQSPLPAAAPSASPTASATGSPTGSPAAGATPTGPALGSDAAGALQAALAAEHAAVYAYGLVGARTAPGPRREDVRACYAAHQARRDSWDRLLAGAGATPTAAAPGYRLPFQVTDEASAGRLAVEVEQRLTAVYADLVAAATGDLRIRAATALRETALQCAHWGGAPGALPGLPAPAVGGSPSPAGSPG